MFGLFKSPPFSDPELGELRRERGLWRGAVLLGEARIPLAISGSRAAPEPEALRIARSISSSFPSWRPSIEHALFEHYLPYAEAIAEEETGRPEPTLPRIAGPSGVWPHTKAEFVQVTPLDGRLAVEIGYRVTWDEEHTLGARLRNGQLIELCGSVLAP